MQTNLEAVDAIELARSRAEGLRCLLVDESEAGSDTTPEALEALSDVAASIRDDLSRALDALGAVE